jgi:hypothetical protein
VLVAFVLVALFIWVAENVATAGQAWVYPDQADGWTPVSLAKLGSWILLMMISVVLVTWVYPPELPDGPDAADGSATSAASAAPTAAGEPSAAGEPAGGAAPP